MLGRLLGCFIVFSNAGCVAGNVTASPSSSNGITGFQTADSSSIQTFQAETVMTADWVRTLTPEMLSSPTLASPTDVPQLIGTPLADRRGPCPASSEFEVHVRQGFCIAAPTSWTALNVDGGLAASLNTTPGQAISLKPDWAASTAECHLLVFVVRDTSIFEHLQPRYEETRAQLSLESLSLIGEMELGDVAVTGYVWEDTLGGRGGAYAAMLEQNRLVHVSEGGTHCPLDQLLPVLDTLRFN